MNEDNFIIRVYCLITVPSLISLNNDSQQIVKQKQESSHLCIFEAPIGNFEQEVLYKSRDFEDLLEYAQIGEWKIADVDGIMKGNPPLSSWLEETLPFCNLKKDISETPKFFEEMKNLENLENSENLIDLEDLEDLEGSEEFEDSEDLEGSEEFAN